MSALGLLFSVVFCSLATLAANPVDGTLRALQSQRFFEARQLIQKLKPSAMSFEDWLKVRTAIHKRPLVGHDVLLFWDHFAPVAANKYDLMIAKADQLMLSKKFQESFSVLQEVAQFLRSNDRNENKLLYWSVLHSMGRALYGAKRFAEALDVYQAIPSAYVYFRQVQFEKMWAAYRANKLEYALGALASQSSGYFTAFLDPEAYLLQYYIYKRMCRIDEAKRVVSNIRTYHKLLEKSALPLKVWLGKDVDTLIIRELMLANKRENKSDKSIFSLVKRRMEIEQKRIKEQMDTVVAYAKLAEGKVKELTPIKHLAEVPKILSDDKEKWDVDDKEVWADELGKHVFIGDDLCSK